MSPLSYFATQLLEILKLHPTEGCCEIMDGILKGSTLEYGIKKVYINTCEHPYVSILL